MGSTANAVKGDPRTLELVAALREVRADIRKVGRQTTLSLAVFMGVLNGIVFTALKLG